MNEQNSADKKKKSTSSVTKKIVFLLVVVGLGLLAYFLWGEMRKPPEPVYEPKPIEEPESEPEPEPEPEPVDNYYPEGQLISSSGSRDAYQDSDLWLYIPRLEKTLPVYNGVDDAALMKGIGLFDQATMPNAAPGMNFNTSIAGHRDVHGSEFYYIDQVEIGDLIYLSYQGDLFTFEVEDSFVTHDEDWDPIRIKDHAVVTLQSCTPIGVASHRIFVVGKLIETEPDATFPDQEAAEIQAAAQPSEEDMALDEAA